MFFKHKKKSAPTEKPMQAQSEPQIFNDGEDEGFYAWTADDLINTPQIKPLVASVSVALGGLSDNFTKYLLPSIKQAALYMQELPAAENSNGQPIRAFGHHVSPGGLLQHSLETMYFALNDSRLAFFNRGVNPGQRDDNLNISRIACALVGLLHDIGKLNDPIVVTYTEEKGRRIEHVWSCVEPIPDFLARVHGFANVADVFKDRPENGKKRPRYYVIGWHKGRDEIHDIIGPFLMRAFLSKATLRLLSQGNNGLLLDVMTAINWDFLPNKFTGPRSNIVADIKKIADQTSSSKDKKTAPSSALPKMTYEPGAKSALTQALYSMENQGRVAIDKADLNCYLFTHAAPEHSQKFFVLMRFDEQALGFLTMWMKEASDIYGSDVLQGYRINLENIKKLLLLCDFLLKPNPEDAIFQVIPNTIKPLLEKPIAAICFALWRDCIDPQGEIYGLNEKAFTTLTSSFVDCPTPENIKQALGQKQASSLGELDFRAVRWDENGNPIMDEVHNDLVKQDDNNNQEIQAPKEKQGESTEKEADKATENESQGENAEKAADKTTESEPQNESEEKVDESCKQQGETDNPVDLEPQEAEQEQEEGSLLKANSPAAPPVPSDDAGGEENSELGNADNIEIEVPALGSSELGLEGSEVNTALIMGGLIDDLTKRQADNASESDATDNSFTAQNLFDRLSGTNPIGVTPAGSDEDETNSAKPEVMPRNFDQAKADFLEEKEAVDEVINVNNPDLSVVDLKDARKASSDEDLARRIERQINKICTNLEDPKLASNLHIMLKARIAGKFSYIDFVTTDGRHCYAAFLWSNEVKQNAQGKQLLRGLINCNLVSGMDWGKEQVNKEIYFYGCVALRRELTDLFVLAGFKPRKLSCREHPYAYVEGRPPEARSVVEFLKYRLLCLENGETLYGYQAHGFADDTTGKRINFAVMSKCMEEFGATSASRVRYFLSKSNQTTPPFLVKEKDELVLYFDLPASAEGEQS